MPYTYFVPVYLAFTWFTTICELYLSLREIERSGSIGTALLCNMRCFDPPTQIVSEISLFEPLTQTHTLKLPNYKTFFHINPMGLSLDFLELSPKTQDTKINCYSFKQTSKLVPIKIQIIPIVNALGLLLNTSSFSIQYHTLRYQLLVIFDQVMGK